MNNNNYSGIEKMNKKQKILYATAVMMTLCWLLPVAGAYSQPLEATAGSYDVMLHAPLGLAKWTLKFEATGVLDIFVTDDSNDVDSYDSTGVIPAGALTSIQASSGSLSITYSDPDTIWYVIFGNHNGGVTITGTFDITRGIPGFTLLFVMFAFLATFGILWSKKKLNF
jgi:hypothetical protein